MVTLQVFLAWRRQLCKGQSNEQQREEDKRRDGKKTSKNGHEWGLEIFWGLRKTERKVKR